MKKLFGTAWVPILLLSTYAQSASGSVNHFAAFAHKCGLTDVSASARVFSDNDNQWKEYSTPKQVPENEEWSETAYAWAKPGSPVVIDVEGLGEDFGDSTYYCFDIPGKLSSLEHEFRTAWGWGFAEEREFDSEGKETVKSHFFSMKTRKEIPRPEGASDVAEPMTVKVYKQLSDVPFFSLLTSGIKNGTDCPGDLNLACSAVPTNVFTADVDVPSRLAQCSTPTSLCAKIYPSSNYAESGYVLSVLTPAPSVAFACSIRSVDNRGDERQNRAVGLRAKSKGAGFEANNDLA